MKRAYVDASCLVGIALREPGWQRARTLMRPYELLVASELLLAECLAVARREQLAEEQASAMTSQITWIVPERSLRPEIERVLAKGYLRGADLWHVASACFYASEPKQLDFLTRDGRQREVAGALGFPTPRFD